MLPSEENAKADVESGVYERMRPIKPGDIVLDLGANVGYFTERAAKAVGPEGWVIAFEPDKTNFDHLVRRTMHFPNVLTIPAAAGNRVGKSNLYHNPRNCGGHSFFMNEQHEGCSEVPVIPIGKWIRRLGLLPDFVKIDTEGAERIIISNMLFWNLKPFFAYETHGTEQYADCLKMLEFHGYDVTPKTETVGVCWATLKP